jgi:hypothetical protein
MNLIVLFGDGAITRKNDGNFASCATRNDAVCFRHFSSGDTLSPNKKINSFLKSLDRKLHNILPFY